MTNRTAKKGLISALFNQIYYEKKDKILHKVLKQTTIKPFMKYREIRIVEEILINLKPKVCLEWGSGYSTLYFSKFLTKDAKWIAIEHNKDWMKRVVEIIHDSRIELCLAQPERPDWEQTDKDGAYADFAGYLAAPAKYKNIDFILVDGRARKDALIKARDYIGDRGVVVLHDANRRIYHQPFSLYKHQALFTDKRTNGGGIWVGSNGSFDIEAVLDVALHKKIWRFYNMF
ncbi:MAG: hypothetical protein A3J24_09160 [Deltaproteobacteria bacterium RIFCSPLOWO2_02_FULL_53_8]|nr:MAG: hypothetical protein A3J24_09160 [Deltaproteobacteria bacterium RIFCSPLOWO2_02_FULL_53_8]